MKNRWYLIDVNWMLELIFSIRLHYNCEINVNCTYEIGLFF